MSNQEHDHGQGIEHTHTISHTHSHTHKNTKAVVNRLARIEGHVRSIKEMAANERDCSDILLQIAAVRKALDSTAKVLLKDHLETCVVEAVYHGNESEVLRDLNKALDHFIR
ncbi:metal-sensing transcriptional repressor [Paenibacillus thiaminolyticus]|uniref:Transcriptional regulator n=1 Tax=Paenibacillus thiaminolyticus TaxID=49283 RepID=A0A3A3GFG0_PANTH|nr:metal-sensing transcriptional repressor [Paenibacillus thiaminolyticus]RJG22487.1 transcriptional regulator [Paenibacillus thiaminolyticus]